MQHRPIVPPLMALTFGILAVSTGSILARYAQGYAPSLVVAAYRLGLATLMLLPLVLWKYRPELRSLGRRELGLGLLSGFFLSIHFATWITSLEYTTVASSVVLVTTTPLWVALLSPLVLKEAINRPVRVGMFLALAGGVVVGLSDTCALGRNGLQCPPLDEFLQGEAFLGDLLALAGAIMAACYILIGRRLREKVSLISYIFVVYGMAAAVLVATVLLSGHKLLVYPSEAYIWFVLLALVPQLIGHSTFNWVLRYISAAYVSISLLGEPVGATILAYLLLGETPVALKIFGAILILIGIYLASRSEGRG